MYYSQFNGYLARSKHKKMWYYLNKNDIQYIWLNNINSIYLFEILKQM